MRAFFFRSCKAIFSFFKFTFLRKYPYGHDKHKKSIIIVRLIFYSLIYTNNLRLLSYLHLFQPRLLADFLQSIWHPWKCRLWRNCRIDCRNIYTRRHIWIIHGLTVSWFYFSKGNIHFAMFIYEFSYTLYECLIENVYSTFCFNATFRYSFINLK